MEKLFWVVGVVWFFPRMAGGKEDNMDNWGQQKRIWSMNGGE